MFGDSYYAARRCLREPIAEIFVAAHLLDRAVGAHLAGDRDAAAEMIRAADDPVVRAWTESLWGGRKTDPNHDSYIRMREVENAPPVLAKTDRVPVRMPNAGEKRELLANYGHCCAFCGIPVIRTEVRQAIGAAYPDALSWGATNPSQHAAFQCMWLQFDHLLPHSRGGGNDIANVAITCAPCNYGRGDRTLEEVGLIDPRERPVHKTSWDGLERFLATG